MTSAIQAEVIRLREILATVDIELNTSDGASLQALAKVEHELGIRFDKHLREFWQFTNGSDFKDWFAVHSDEVTGCSFTSLEASMEAWSWFTPYDDSIYKEWRNERPTDPRIRQGMLHHRLWFPIAESNCFSTSVYFDADPAPGGKYGQIIVYQHDPDAIYYIAESFLDFFRLSNSLLPAKLTDLYFLGDEFERIVRMKGLGELKRQLAAGLNLNQPNWQHRTLVQHAKEEGRQDIVDYLSKRI